MSRATLLVLDAIAIVLAALVLGVALPAASANAAGWVVSAPLSDPGRQAGDVAAAMGPGGERAVAWTNADLNGDHSVTSVRSAGPTGPFGPAQDLGRGYYPAVACGADGSAFVAWVWGQELHVARRAPGETAFAEAAPLSLVGSVDTGPPQIAVRDGVAYLAVVSHFDDSTGTLTDVNVARLPAAPGARVERVLGTGSSGALQVVKQLAGGQDHHVTDVQLAVTADQVVAAWKEVDYTSGQPGQHTLRAALAPRRDGGTFPAPTAVRTLSSNYDLALAADADRADVIWDGDGTSTLAKTLTSSDPIRTLIADRPNLFGVRAGFTPGGELVVAGSAFPQGIQSPVAFGGAAAPGGALAIAPIDALTGNRVLSDLALAFDGTAVALTWLDYTGWRPDLRAAVRAPGGGFGPAEEVTPGPLRQWATMSGATVVHVTAGNGGHALAAFSAADPQTGAALALVSERDLDPPAFGAVSVPAAAERDAPVALAAEATDTLDATRIDWDFGDGAHATGPVAVHAFAQAGRSTVTITATDGTGNRATVAREIAIGGATSGPVPLGGGADARAPILSALKLSHARFRVAPSPTATVAAATPRGTRLSLRVDERSTIVVEPAGTVAGRRAGGRCVPGGRAGRPCHAAVTAPALVRTARGPGTVTIPYSGRSGGRALAAGRYTAKVTAIDAAGNRSRPRTVSFTVVTK